MSSTKAYRRLALAIGKVFIYLGQHGIKATSTRIVQKLKKSTELDKEGMNEYQSIEKKEKHTRLITNFHEYDEFIRKVIQLEFYGKPIKECLVEHRLDFLSFVKFFGSSPPDCDPFSQEYADWEISFFNFLAGKEYDSQSEGYQICDLEWLMNQPPTINMDITTRMQGMKTYTDLLEVCKPTRDMSVLEMGSGLGNLLELFGRCGCNVTGIEASEGSSTYARQVLSAQNIKNEIIKGTFYDIEFTNSLFDIIIFESAFHHCGEPLRLLNILNKKLSKDGKLLFLNEPIEPVFERPWGVVRYDGESAMQIRRRGWLELGYRLDFFEELLRRTGFILQNSHTTPDGGMLHVAVINE